MWGGVYKNNNSVWQGAGLLLGLLLVSGIANSASLPSRLDFDHLTTGFPLTGQHEFVVCETCHVNGVFRGTPKQCAGCHNSVVARGKSQNHIPTVALCDSCHSTLLTF